MTNSNNDNYVYIDGDSNQEQDEYVMQLYNNILVLESNRAGVFGAAIGVSRHWADNETESTIYINNTQPNFLINVTNCSLIENFLAGTNESSVDEAHGGAAIGWYTEPMSDITVLINSSTFYKNTAVSQGAALFTTCFECANDDNSSNGGWLFTNREIVFVLATLL